MNGNHFHYCKIKGMRWYTKRPDDKNGVLVNTFEKNDNARHRSLKHKGFDIDSLQKEKEEKES